MASACMNRCAFVCLLLLNTFAAAQTLPAPPKQPRRPTTRPFVAQELFGSYWTLEPGWHTDLQVRNNLGFRELTVTPVLRTFQGTEVPLDPVTLKSDEVTSINLEEAAAKHAPNLLHTANAYGSVVFRYTSPDETNVFAGAMVHSPGRPISLHFDAEPRVHAEVFDKGFYESIWWLPSADADGYLVLTNTAATPIQTRVVFTSRNDILYDQPVVLGPRQVRRLRIRELLRPETVIGQTGGVSIEVRSGADNLRISHFMVDETAETSAMLKVYSHVQQNEQEAITLRAPMIALANPDSVLGLATGARLNPSVTLRNTALRLLSVTPVLNWKTANRAGTIRLPLIALQTGETKPLDISVLQSNGTIPEQAQWASLALNYTGADNDLIGLAVTTDTEGKVVAQTPFSQALSFLFKGSAWYADGTRNSLITVGNGGTEPTTASVVLFYNNANGKYEQQRKLAPGEQMWVDVAQLIRNQVPDNDGRTIPPDVKFGSYELRDLDHIASGTLFEGKLTIDKTYGHAAYGCGFSCCYYDPWLEPSSYTGPIGSWYRETPRATCSEDAFDYDISSFVTDWTSSNSGVATFGFYGGDINLVGAGSSTIRAYATIDSRYSLGYCKPMSRSASATANAYAIDATISAPRTIQDGSTASFNITSQGTPSSISWSWSAPSGSGNSPSVTFNPSSGASTTTNGRWFANPNGPCSASTSSTYTIRATVYFPNGPVLRSSSLTVNIPWDPAGKVDTSVTTISGSPTDAADQAGI
jgi:hypothetical protein